MIGVAGNQVERRSYLQTLILKWSYVKHWVLMTVFPDTNFLLFKAKIHIMFYSCDSLPSAILQLSKETIVV